MVKGHPSKVVFDAPWKCPVKYLGVQLDSDLDWNQHMKVLCSKVYRAIGFFYIYVIKILQYILRSTLLTRIILHNYWDKTPGE